MKDTIAAVLVTWNRRALLANCLKSILSQSTLPNYIIIVDNNSTDGSQEFLEKEGLISLPIKITAGVFGGELFQYNYEQSNRNPIDMLYLNRYQNEGGAGGFYAGIQIALEFSADWIWLMDDDGKPEKSQLETLYGACKEQSIYFANALVLNKDDPDELAFELLGFTTRAQTKGLKIIENAANLFNGTFIHADVPNTIGNIKKEMFIWGDENEYYLRAQSYGYIPCTVVNAIHFHPSSKTTKIFLFPWISKIEIELKPSDRLPLFIRNKAYLLKTYYNTWHVITLTIKYLLYALTRLKPIMGFRLMKAIWNGVTNNFK